MECSFWCNFYSDIDLKFSYVNLTGIIKGLKQVIILTVLGRSILPVWRYVIISLISQKLVNTTKCLSFSLNAFLFR
jgi:hypothetical protein